MTEQNDAATEIVPPENTEDSAATGQAEGDQDLDFILDIPLQVSVELGRTHMLVNDLLQLGQGSVVELTKSAGEPMEIFVNGRLFARGEALVVNEKFGVRLTDIISPAERVKTLG
ncbi:MAG: flagellar motor switch protein FliN [Desulfobacterales bacterium]|nr:flagellar motor switch protein FliN [Desulfobacterales bacterium]